MVWSDMPFFSAPQHNSDKNKKKFLLNLSKCLVRMYSNQSFQPNMIIFLPPEQQKTSLLFIYFEVSKGYKKTPLE